MKKNNLKIRQRRISLGLKNLSVKKTSAKGVILKSVKNENPNRGATTPRPSLVRRGMGRFGVSKNENPKPETTPADSPLVNTTTPRPSLVRRGMGRWFRSLKFGFRIYRVAGLFVLFAILGFTVWQALLPQSARSKTFTFFQTAWSSVAGTAAHSPVNDQTEISTYASKDAQISVTPDTDVTLAATAGSKSAGTINDAFTGTPTNTQVNNSGAPATVSLSTATYQTATAAIDYNTAGNYTYDTAKIEFIPSGTPTSATLKNQGTPAEITPDANTKALWHLNNHPYASEEAGSWPFSSGGGNNWQYRKAVYINGSTAIQSNYQVLIPVNTQSLIVAGKMKSDGSDIRFANSSGTELPYWIESGINTANTRIWVKIDSIAASPSVTTIYLNYGNSTAASVSSSNTFDFFYDFAGTTIDTAKLTFGGGTITQNNELSIINNVAAWDEYAYANTTFARSPGKVFQAKFKANTGTHAMIGWHDSGAGASYTDLVYGIYFNGGSFTVYEDGTDRVVAGQTYTVGQWYDVKIELKSAGAIYYYKLTTSSAWTTLYNSSYSSEASLRPGIVHFDSAYYSYTDDWKVRSFISPEPSVVVANDSSTNNNLGYTYTNSETAPTLTTAGKFTNALSFDGTDDYVDVPASASTNGGWAATTVEGWFKFNNLTGIMNIIDKRNAANTQYSYNLQFNRTSCTSGSIAFFARNTTGSQWATDRCTSGAVITSTTDWYHIAAVYDGTDAGTKIYINGSEVSTTPHPGSTGSGGTILTVSDNSLKIGRAGAASVQLFSGSLDEVAIWDTALSAATIASHAGIDYSPATGATVVNTTALSLTNISAFTSFTETATKPANTTIDYQLSNDNGATWCNYATGAWSCTAENTNYTLESDITDPAMAAFPIGNGTLKIKAQLNTTNGLVRPELGNVNVGYITTVPATYNSSGDYTSAVYDTGQKSDFTTAAWTATTTGANSFTHTSGGDFDGTNASTKINGSGNTASVSLLESVSSGADGACIYTSNTSLDTTAKSTYNCTTFTINSGVTVTYTGSNPLIIKVSGNVSINGTLKADGADGVWSNSTTRAAGGPGGGSGGYYNVAGLGTGHGAGGGSNYKSGAGGGFGGSGGNSGSGAIGGSAYGSAVDAGSGGGGGKDTGAYGGGGGGGGGAVSIASSGNISIASTGIITANGGAGNTYTYGAGGGGSGGGIQLNAFGSVVNNGIVRAKGGGGGVGGGSYGGNGGNGGGGRIAVYDDDGVSAGTYQLSAGTGGVGGGNTTTVFGLTLPGTTNYFLSGTYTSTIKAVGSGTKFGTISWAPTSQPANTTLVMKVRSCDDVACGPGGTNNIDESVTKPFSSITQTVCTTGCTISNGGNLSSLSSVVNGDGWIQYEATLSNGGDTTKTPSLDDVTITTIPLVLEMRAGSDNTDCPGACTGWTGWTEIGSGATPASPVSLGTTFDGNQYIQYRAKFSTVNTAYSPSLDDISFNYSYYPVGEYKLISSAFDSGQDVNLATNISWNESIASGTTDIKFQVRTAPDNAGSPDWTSVNASKWCGPTSCAATTGNTDYAGDYYTTPAGENLNPINRDNGSDQWMQYAAFLSTTEGNATPTLSGITLQYVINASPAVSSVSASPQDATGKSTINYTIYDEEEGGTNNQLETYYFYDAGTALSGALAQNAVGTITLTNSISGILDKIPATGYLLIDNEIIQYNNRQSVQGTGPYTVQLDIISGGRGKWISGTPGYTTIDAAHNNESAVWIPISDSALTENSTPNRSNKYISCSVSSTCLTSGTAKTYSVIWDPNNHFDGLYKTGVKVRVAVNDKNAANQMSTGSGGESSAVTIDTKNPVLAGLSFSVKDASDDSISATDSRTVKLTVSGITDNSNIELQFSNNGTDWGSATNATGGISNTGWITGLDSTQTYTNTAWVLPTGNGSKTVYVRVRDQFGNPSAAPSSADDASISYNITPEFNADYDNNILGYTCYGAGANGVCIRQLTISDDIANAGKVEIKYQVRDQDTDESFVSPDAGNVNVFFKYTTNGGTDWNYVINNLSGDGTTPTPSTNVENAALQTVNVATDGTIAVLDTAYTTHTTYWDAKTALGEGFNYTSPNFKIMAFVDDGESSLSRNGSAAGNTGQISAGTSLDIKDPELQTVVGQNGTVIHTDSGTVANDAITTSRSVSFSYKAIDDTTNGLVADFANAAVTGPFGSTVDALGAVTGGTTAYTSNSIATQTAWTLAKSTANAAKNVWVRFTDQFGNSTIANDAIDYNIAPTATVDSVQQCQIGDVAADCPTGRVKVTYTIRDQSTHEATTSNTVDSAGGKVKITAVKYSTNSGSTFPSAAPTLEKLSSDTATAISGSTAIVTLCNPATDSAATCAAAKQFTLLWYAKNDITTLFTDTGRIRLEIDDGERNASSGTMSGGALATAADNSGTNVVLDTQNPALGGSPILINGNNPSTVIRASTLSLSTTDDSALYSQYSNNDSSYGAATDSFGDLDNTQGSTASQVTGRYGAYGASKSWTLWTPKLANDINASTQTIPLTFATGLPTSGWILIGAERIYYPSISGSSLINVSRAQADTAAVSHTADTAVEADGMRTAYVKFLDIYGNGLTVGASSDTIIYDQTPAGVIHDVSIQDASNTATGNWRLFLSWRTLETASLTTDFKQYKIFRCKTGTLTDTNCPVALSSGIDEAVTTIPVNDTATLAAAGTIDIGGEIITYTGKTDTTLTGATRGANNTTAASHSSGAQVYGQLTNLTAQTAVLSSISGIDATQTTGITLNSVSGFASSGTVLIDSEAITYTALTDTTLSGTVTRGAKGTTAAIHSSGAQVQSLDANLTTNFYTDNFSSTDSANANPNQTKYFYFVRSEDLAGNVAPKSSIVSSVPNGAGGRDTIPVRVYDNVANCSNNTDTGTGGLDSAANTTSGIDCSTRGTNSATIKWKTKNTSTDINTGDQDQGKGDSFVEYGTVSGTYTNSAGLHEYVASHSIALTGLQPNTTYYFRVRTRDGIGNIDTTKTDGTGGISLERSFTTRDIDTPTSVSAAPFKNSATITWSTIDQTNSLIEYWKLSDQTTQTATCNYSNIALNKVNTAGTENEAVTSHSISIAQKLSTSSDYCFRVKSKDTNNNNITGSAVKFTTLGVPVISNARTEAADIQTNTSIVKWSTSDNTTSYLEFWKSGTSGKKTAGGDTLATAHSVQLPDDLLTNTKYYFQIKSKDDADNAIISVNANCAQADGGGCYFTTNAPPAPGAISVSSVGMNKAEILWATTGGNDGKTNSIVEYVRDAEYNTGTPSATVWKTAGDDTQVSNHSVALPIELIAGTKYYIRVRTKDNKNNAVASSASAQNCPTGTGNGYDVIIGECYFTSKIAPVISTVQVANKTINSFQITWTTDVAANSLLQYGSDNNYGFIEGDDDTETTSHSVTVNGLDDNSAYHFRVRSKGITTLSSSNTKVTNLSETNDFTTTTDVDPGDITPPVISDVSAGSVTQSGAIISWNTDEPSTSQVFYTTSNPQTAEMNMKPETRNMKPSFVLGVEDISFKIQVSAPIAYAASNQQNDSSLKFKDSGSWLFTARLTLSRSLAWLADHMPQVSLAVSFMLGAVFAVFAALLLVMANYMRGGWKLNQILKMTPVIVLKNTSSGFCALANSDNQGTWQASFAVYSKHRNITRKTIGMTLALGALKIFLSTSIPVFLLSSASFAAVNYSSTSLDLAKNTTHRVELSGLNSAAAYWIYVSSSDSAGNNVNTISSPLSFTTAAAPDTVSPVISNIQISNVGSDSARVSWDTNESSDSFVEYGADTNYGKISGQEEGATSHSVNLSGLASGTTYHFRAKSKDASGNIGTSADQTLNTVAVDSTPSSISNLKVVSVSKSDAIITWDTDKAADSYIEYGSDANYGKASGQESRTLNHSVTVSGLASGTTYHFRAKSKDASGNIGTSADQLITTVLADETAPTISNIQITGIADSEAVIAWETNETGDSFVEYGADVNYGSSSGQEEGKTSHSVKLTGLKGNTLYHILAKSKDISGNVGRSADQSFTTSAGPINIPPKISAEGPRVEDLKPVSAKILWKTDKPSSSIVAFGKDINYGTEIGNIEELITEHTVQLIGLDPKTIYRFKVKSADTDGNIGESPDKEFATPEKPIISKVAASEISMTSAIVAWETSTSITSEIEYGKTVAYGKNIIDKSLSQTTQHTVKIDGLESGVQYRFRAKGTDQYGSIVQSDNYTFSTIAEPKIAKFEIESVTNGSAVIVWETNTDTDSLVEYQKDGDTDAKTAGTTDLAKDHKIKIDKLEDNAKFRTRIVGRDALGNEVKSDYKEFLTLADTEAPKITGVKTESSIPSSGEESVQVLVSWTTDEPATSQVEYRQGVALGKNYPSKSRLDTNLSTSHLAVLSGFKTSDIYHFRAVSKDRAGNEGASADYTILTPQKKESLLQIILKNLEESFGFLRKLGK